MNYLNITKYIYLVVGCIMAYDAYSKWGDSTDKPWLSLALAALAFFTFFFRSRFNKKFEDRNNSKEAN